MHFASCILNGCITFHHEFAIPAHTTFSNQKYIRHFNKYPTTEHAYRRTVSYHIIQNHQTWLLNHGFCAMILLHLGSNLGKFSLSLSKLHHILFKRIKHGFQTVVRDDTSTPTTVVTEEKLLHIILLKRIKHGFLGESSNHGPCATDVLLPHRGVLTEKIVWCRGAWWHPEYLGKAEQKIPAIWDPLLMVSVYKREA